MQTERKKRIRNVCKNTSTNASRSDEAFAFSHIIVNDNYKLLFCFVPKVASTNWKKVLLVLQERSKKRASQINSFFVNDPNNSPFTTLSEYEPTERKYRLDNYFKFMFTRDPMERVVSAYRNKFEKAWSDFFQINHGKAIVRKYRKKPSAEALAKGNDVTFSEFAQFLADEDRRGLEFNEHWERYHKLCSPCSIEYSYIGMYETLEADTAYIMNTRNISKLVSLPRQGRMQGGTRQLVDSYMRQLSPDLLKRLKDIYSLDYDLFGYSK